MLRFFANVIWFLCGGVLMGLGWWLAGLVAAITIIGLPWARACFVIGTFSFWPFGSIARRAGAFFIRRTFKGDKIYSATLRAYVKYLLRERFTQEFFPEGGRSRTGKLLFPKTGLLSMEVDAWADGAAEDVLFIPIAVDYERLVEGTSYAQELAGGEKKKESFGALLQTPRALLRSYLSLIHISEPTRPY